MQVYLTGQRIKRLREKSSIPAEDLAIRAGISHELLAQIEAGKAEKIDSKQLLSIADNLKLKNSHDFAWLMKENSQGRSFKAYVVGLPKTGTASLYGMFSNYRAHHELCQWHTLQMLIKYKRDEISRNEMTSYLIKREVKGNLPELDSAHFNSEYMDMLAEEFPDAKFICLVRDCFSWLESYINYCTEPNKECLNALDLDNGFPFDLPKGECEEKEELVRNFSKYIDVPLRFWANRYMELMDKLPLERSLIMRTKDLSNSMEKIAHFVGVTPESLETKYSHINKRPEKRVKLLNIVERGLLRKKMEEHCRAMMEELFPELSFDSYLDEKLGT